MKKKFILIFFSVGFFLLGSLVSLHTSEAACYASSTYDSWSHCRTITINHLQVSSSSGSFQYANFPVLVSITTSTLRTIANGGFVGSSTGNDILFTKSDDSFQFNHEIENYVSSTGELEAWVNVSSTLSTSTDTVFNMYYGNVSSGNQQHPTSTWDSNYLGVWHFPSVGSSLSLMDSAGLTTTPTNHGGGITSGKIDGAGTFNGSSQWADAGGPVLTTSTNALTVSSWVWMNSGFSGINMVLSNIINSGSDSGFDLYIQPNNPIIFEGFGAGNLLWQAYDGATTATNSWHYLVGTLSGSTVKIYLDGTDVTANVTSHTGYVAGVQDLDFGRFAPVSEYFLNGNLDESRISNAALSSDWIKTEYNNQSSPSTFETFGADTAAVSVSVSPQSAVNSTTTLITLTGVSTLWTGQNSSTLFSISGVSGASLGIPTILSNTGATAVLTTSSTLGTITLTDNSTGATTTITVSPTPGCWATPTYDAWLHCRTITINHLQVSSSSGSFQYANFPVLISVTTSSLKSIANGGFVASSTGNDILFAKSDDSFQFNHEIENYVSSTGELEAWVNVSSTLSTSTDTVFNMYYGNVSSSNEQHPTATWDSNYLDVWHLAHGSSSLSVLDSTGRNMSTNNGATSAPGEIDGAAQFASSSSEYVSTLDNTSTRPSSLTYSYWFERNGAQSNYAHITEKGNDGVAPYGTLFTQFNGADSSDIQACIGFTSTYDQCWDGGDIISSGVWYNIAQTYDGSVYKVYENGVLQSQTTQNLTVAYDTNPWILGGAQITGQSSTNFFNGSIDEVELSNTPLSADWIKTAYNNQSSPSIFATFSPDSDIEGFSVQPQSVVSNATTSLTFTESSTLWTGQNSSTLFSISGVSGASLGIPTILSNTSATAVLTTGNATGTLTITDNSTGQTALVSVFTAPVISGVSCAGNSPSSILCSWITDIPSYSQVQCGTSSGGPYTTYQTTIVYASSTGPGAGVTSHSMIIPGLQASTNYWCQGVSAGTVGVIGKSSVITTATNAPLVSTPIAIGNISPMTRYNDQYSGSNSHGLTANGRACDGDTFYPTAWASDGNLYGPMNDTQGCTTNGGSYPDSSNIAFFKVSPSNLFNIVVTSTLSTFGTTAAANTNGWSDGATWKSENAISVKGNIFLAVTRQLDSGSFTPGNGSLVESSNDGATWLAPQNYPNGTPQATGDAPTGGNAMWPGSGSGQKCSRITFSQHGQDYGGASSTFSFVNYGNADAFVYALCTDGTGAAISLVRVRTEDIALLDPTKYQYYAGGDGLLDVNWSSTASSAYNLAPFIGAGLDNFEFIPDFNRWIVTGPLYAANSDTYSVRIFEAQYPWGSSAGPSGWTEIGRTSRVQAYLNFQPAFSIPLIATYKKLASAPLASQITVMTSGQYLGQTANAPSTDEYSPHWFNLTFVPRFSTKQPPLITPNGSRTTHIGNGMDLFYSMQWLNNFTSTVEDSSPNGLYSATGLGAHPIYDQYGMIDFGLAGGLATNCSPACATPIQSYTLTTPYMASSTNFTVALVFSHLSSIAPVSNEMVLDKTDLEVFRNDTTANSWEVTVAGTTSSPFSMTTDGFGATSTAVLIIRRFGSNVTIYRDDFSCPGTGCITATSTLPLTTVASFSAGIQLGANTLYLGSKSNSSQPFYGWIDELAIWHRALSDSEIIKEMDTIRTTMKTRGIILP